MKKTAKQKDKITFIVEPTNDEVAEFLTHSNYIEGVYGQMALDDAMEAWKFLREQSTVTDKEILHVHYLLMQNLNPRIAGRLRRCSVRIGSQIKHYTTDDELIYQLRTALAHVWASFYLKGDKEQLAKDCHVQFEDVHPFEDGNGRTGRILYNWHRLQLGLPIHIIHEGDEQMSYYQWFRGA